MTKAIVQTQFGGPEVFEWRTTEIRPPKAGEVRIQHTAIGLNYIDTYVRTGMYPLMQLPGSPGMEAAGLVVDVGVGVTHLALGDRVAYVHNVPGAYAEHRVMDANRLVKLPPSVDDRAAAALMLKGMTAEILLHRTTQATAGDTVLIHAAAGGVGLLLTTWAKHIGCTVIATVGSQEKAALVKTHGADHVIVTSEQSTVSRVQEITSGKGCRYVYDGVGKDSFEDSLAVVAKFGHVVSFGNASGAVPPLSIAALSPKCVALSRPMIFPHIAERADLESIANNLFGAMQAGVIKAGIHQIYALQDAAQAHRDLQARKTTGQTVLLP